MKKKKEKTTDTHRSSKRISGDGHIFYFQSRTRTARRDNNGDPKDLCVVLDLLTLKVVENSIAIPLDGWI